MTSVAKKLSSTKDFKKRSSKRHTSKHAKEVHPPIDALVELEVAGPEKSAYEHGLQRYLREAPSFLDKTEILTPGALPPEKSCFRRNLPGILFASLVLLFTVVVFVEVADKGTSETKFFYPTPETTTVAATGNSTDEDSIEAILVEERNELFGGNQDAQAK